MGRTWDIWLHPRRAARDLQELRNVAEDLSGRLDKAMTTVGNQESFIVKIKGDLDTASQLREKSDASVMELTRQILKLRKELDSVKLDLKVKDENLSRKDQELADKDSHISRLQDELTVKNEELAEAEELGAAMEQFERTLSKAEEMKAAYEGRISRLRAKIVELKEHLSKPTPSQEGSVTPPKGSNANPPEAILFSDPDEDWLQPLP